MNLDRRGSWYRNPQLTLSNFQRLLIADYDPARHGHLITSTTSTQHFGGVRTWFHCPKCDRRCAVLYWVWKWLCVRCAGAYYRTQQNDHRAIRCENELQRIAYHLKCPPDYDTINGPLPPRPKLMRWRRYMRLAQRFIDLRNQRVYAIMGR